MMRLPTLLAVLLALPAAALAQPRIVAENGPLADIARTLAGNAATVEMPLPKGADPAAWRPALDQIAGIQQADLILLNGAGFSGWSAKVSLPRARTVVTTAAVEDRLIVSEGLTHSHGPEGAHTHAATVSQTWLDPALAAAQARAVAGGLARVLPGQAAAIDAALARFRARMDRLSDRLAAAGAALDARTVIAAHRGLDYFARAAGLDLVSLDWVPGAAPDDDDLAALDAALAEGAGPLILWQVPPDPRAEAAAAARGLTGVLVAPGATAADLPTLLEGNIARLEKAAAGG